MGGPRARASEQVKKTNSDSYLTDVLYGLEVRTDEIGRLTMNYQLLNTAEAAEVVRLAVATLEKMRTQGQGPRFVKLGRAVRYRRIDLEDWIASSVIGSTSEQPSVCK